MKKLEKRAMICLLLILAMLAGLVYFIVKLETNGAEWASYYANSHVFRNGTLNVGVVKDRDGDVLLSYDDGGAGYADDETVRRACSVLTGDVNFNISAGANVAFRSRLIGYNFVTGTEGFFGVKGGTVNLNIDKDLNVAAYNALGNREGFVCVYNWKTGEIECLVSTPTVDPADPNGYENAASGAYINKVLNATFTPGSTFKVLTALAAIENIDDIDSRTFSCTGSQEISGNIITCPYAHGTMDFSGALASSCNCAFGELAYELGPDVMKKYVQKMRLDSSYDINGIDTAEGSFKFKGEPIELAWAGIGQYEDKANPMSLLIFMGAIAGNGEAAVPSLIQGEDEGYVSLMDSDTASILDEMLRNDVISNYGDDNYPGLKLRAKSGSAETGDGKDTHAWFYGYSGDHAFIVLVENGGAGATVAGPIANTVLQEIAGQENN